MKLSDHIDEILFFGGLVLLSTGLVFVYWPLALIVPGVLMIVVGFVMALRGGN